jgi:hypothetical protein
MKYQKDEKHYLCCDLGTIQKSKYSFSDVLSGMLLRQVMESD